MVSAYILGHKEWQLMAPLLYGLKVFREKFPIFKRPLGDSYDFFVEIFTPASSFIFMDQGSRLVLFVLWRVMQLFKWVSLVFWQTWFDPRSSHGRTHRSTNAHWSKNGDWITAGYRSSPSGHWSNPSWNWSNPSWNWSNPNWDWSNPSWNWSSLGHWSKPDHWSIPGLRHRSKRHLVSFLVLLL